MNAMIIQLVKGTFHPLRYVSFFARRILRISNLCSPCESFYGKTLIDEEEKKTRVRRKMRENQVRKGKKR